MLAVEKMWSDEIRLPKAYVFIDEFKNRVGFFLCSNEMEWNKDYILPM